MPRNVSISIWSCINKDLKSRCYCFDMMICRDVQCIDFQARGSWCLNDLNRRQSTFFNRLTVVAKGQTCVIQPDRLPGPVLSSLWAACAWVWAVSTVQSECETTSVIPGPPGPPRLSLISERNYDKQMRDSDQRVVKMCTARLLAGGVKEQNVSNVGSLPNGHNNKCLDDHISVTD